MSSLIIVGGEEEFLKEREAREYAISTLSDEIFEFLFPKGEAQYLEYSQHSFLDSKKRVFIAWDVKNIPVLPVREDDTLIVVSAKKTKLSDKRASRTFNVPKLKFTRYQNGYIKWIINEGNRYNIDLSRVAGALFVNHGMCVRKLASEIEKLSVLAEPNSVISPELAKSVLCSSVDLDPILLVNSVNSGNTPRVLAAFDKIQETGSANGRIIAYMIRHVLEMLKLEKSSPGSTTRSSARQEMLDNLKKWSIPSLVRSVKVFRDLDIKNKQGDPTVSLGLQFELIKLSEEAKA